MVYAQYCSSGIRRLSFYWSINFKTLTLQAASTSGLKLDQTFKTLAELEKCYREQIAPLFGTIHKHGSDCTDSEGSSKVRPVTDFVAFEKELRACGHDWTEPMRAKNDPVEEMLSDLTTRLRREINRAIGPEKTKLEHVVLHVGDGKIWPANINPPAIAGMSDQEIARFIKKDKALTWQKGKQIDFSLKHEEIAWGDLEDLWGEDTWRCGSDGLLGATLDLVAVRIEANPRLRDNISIPGTLRIFFTFPDVDDWVAFDLRKIAMKYLDKPGLGYFKEVAKSMK